MIFGHSDRNNRSCGRAARAASLLLAAVFVLFYPVLSGRPYGAPGTALGQNLLQWLPTWPI